MLTAVLGAVHVPGFQTAWGISSASGESCGVLVIREAGFEDALSVLLWMKGSGPSIWLVGRKLTTVPGLYDTKALTEAVSSSSISRYCVALVDVKTGALLLSEAGLARM